MVGLFSFTTEGSKMWWNNIPLVDLVAVAAMWLFGVLYLIVVNM